MKVPTHAPTTTSTPNSSETRAWTQFAAATWFAWPAAIPNGAPPADALRRFGMAAWVGHALERHDDPRATQLKPDVDRTRLRNTFALSELRACLQLWRSHGIEATPLKGAAFLLAHGRDAVAVRPMSDVDVLVSPSDYRRAVELLGERGYEHRSADHDPITAATVNECTLVRQIGRISVAIDLHRRFGAWPTMRPVARLSRLEQCQGEECRLPTAVAVAVIGIAHRARRISRTDRRELVDIFDAWLQMDATDAERFAAWVEAAGLQPELVRCWQEITDAFRPPESSMPAVRAVVARVGASASADAAANIPRRPWEAWRREAAERYGYGSTFELAAAGLLYASARMADRLLFRRGAARLDRRRKPASEEPRHYWQRGATETD